MRTARAMRCGALSFAAFLVAATAGTAHAQPMWQVTNAGVYLEGNGRANEYINDLPGMCMPDCVDMQVRTVLIPGFQGLSYGTRYGFDCTDQSLIGPPLRESVVVASSKGKATIDGDGSSLVTIQWLIRASTESDAIDGYDAQSDAAIEDTAGGGGNFFVELDTTGVPNGTPLIILYSWDAASRAFNKTEPIGVVCPFLLPPPDDYARIKNATMQIDGVDLLGPAYSFDVIPPFTGIDQTLINQTGQINIPAGQKIQIDVTGIIETGIYMEGRGFTMMEDAASGIFFGRIRLSVGTPTFPPTPPTPIPAPSEPFVDFSVDIGGDAELSAMPPTGNEVFDPGDVYAWHGPALPFPGGADGYRDDAFAFTGIDPPPDAGALGPPVAPVCSGTPIGLVSSLFFDLDGHDAMEFSLSAALQMGTRPPIAFFANSPCIYGADHLIISFEDDGADPYTMCDVPNTLASPQGFTHGPTPVRDEVIGLTLDTSPPVAILNQYPVANEREVHISLAPNPVPGAEADDDDVDSLDAPAEPACGYVYFSCDHEATYFDPINGISLDPGDIYEVLAGAAPIRVIDHALHLGLPDGVDIADFEFVWLENPNAAGNPVHLALVFAVHPDDPTTPGDESGGLTPRRLYYSFLTGSSAPLFPGILDDPIDAVAAIPQDISTLPPPCCVGDADKNGIVNFADVLAVLANFLNPGANPNGSSPGDANCNGVINFADVLAVLANFGRVCP